jgi:hypothetical protein
MVMWHGCGGCCANATDEKRQAKKNASALIVILGDFFLII